MLCHSSHSGSRNCSYVPIGSCRTNRRTCEARSVPSVVSTNQQNSGQYATWGAPLREFFKRLHLRRKPSLPAWSDLFKCIQCHYNFCTYGMHPALSTNFASNTPAISLSNCKTSTSFGLGSSVAGLVLT